MNSVFRNVTITIFIFAFILPSIAFSQSTTESISDREARLRAELAQVEKEQKETEIILKETQGQSASLKRDITILDTKIKVAQLNIKAKNLLIESLGKDISNKEKTIETLAERIDRGRETLTQIMRKTNEIDSITIPEIILTSTNLTNIFSDLDDFESLQKSLLITFEEIRNAKTQTETEKEELDDRRSQEMDAKYAIQQEEKNIKGNQGEKQKLLNISKNNEQTYSQVLTQKNQRAAEIRAALFSLRDAAPIPFGDALKYANFASQKTGVRPAFILAILTQESALGANVGSCYLTNQDTGAGASAKSGRVFSNVMKPTRDVKPFVSITKSLGLDPMKTLVSCPQSVGWGGAMGPAQFIPSTWVLFEDSIASMLGISQPDPWNPQHAFMASAIYLGDLGALGGSYTKEQNAACRYYSGRSCSASALIKSYGTQVMVKADSIQRNMIDPLQGL